MWEEVECPTLILRGSESTFFPKETAESMISRTSDAQLIEIEGAGHTPPLRTEHEIDIIKEFYKSYPEVLGLRHCIIPSG